MSSVETARGCATAPATARWLEAAVELDGWVSSRDYAGADPHDLLASPIVRALSFRNRWLAVAWLQLGRRLPIDVRGVLRVPALRNPKALALGLASQTRLDTLCPGESCERTAGSLVRALSETGSSAYGGMGWGYPFPWANRAFSVPAGMPSSVATAFAGEALLDASDAFGFPDALQLAAGAAEFMVRGLNRVKRSDETFAFSYTPADDRVVHNANLLAAAFLARSANISGNAGMMRTALAAAQFSARMQRTDGSWEYGTAARDHWVDALHTSYCITALEAIGRHARTDEFDVLLRRGFEYWRTTFVRGPAVRFSPRSDFPIDMHAVAHAIITLVQMRHQFPAGLDEARRLAEWSLQHMRSDSGPYFHYRRYRYFTNRIVYMRWIQCWMIRALVELATAEQAEIQV